MTRVEAGVIMRLKALLESLRFEQASNQFKWNGLHQLPPHKDKLMAQTPPSPPPVAWLVSCIRLWIARLESSMCYYCVASSSFVDRYRAQPLTTSPPADCAHSSVSISCCKVCKLFLQRKNCFQQKERSFSCVFEKTQVLHEHYTIYVEF